MKLIIAIVNNDDSAAVQTELTKAGYFATKLATTGGFLKTGNTTYLIGVADNSVDNVISIVKNFSRKRSEIASSYGTISPEIMQTPPVEINVGGATVFVLNVEKFEKL